MRRISLLLLVVLALAGCLYADANLKIFDVGLHGCLGNPTAVRLSVTNPLPQKQSIRLQVIIREEWTGSSTVTGDVSLDAGENRIVEFPVLTNGGQPEIVASSTVGGTLLGKDSYKHVLRNANLIALMCSTDEACKTAQTQIQFSGSVEDRADKNRQVAFEVVSDPRENWWAYSGAKAVVLAIPLSKLTMTQLEALEGYLRRGGRLVLVEQAIADPDFLAAYRKDAPTSKGERVGKGLLFRVATFNTLGDAFAGPNLLGVLNGQVNTWWLIRTNFLQGRYATAFEFPRLRWLLIWLAAYIVIIGVLNFVALQRLRLLEFGWISTTVLALLFAAGMYYSSASRRPKEFHVDNLATYYLDGNSALAAADYNLRLSTPERQDIFVSVNDPAIFVGLNIENRGPSNSQIWAEINRSVAGAEQSYDMTLGPPRRLEFPLLKWSFRDLELEGLRQFPGTVHFVGPNRLRNDSGKKLSEPVYADYEKNAVYTLPDMEPGAEVALDSVPSKPIRVGGQTVPMIPAGAKDPRLLQFAVVGSGPFSGRGRTFAAMSDGPGLPVDVNVHNVAKVHSLIVVSLGQQ